MSEVSRVVKSGLLPAQRPHPGWWVSILFGMTLTSVLALSEGAYTWWAAEVTTLLSHEAIWRIFVLAVILHVLESVVSWRLCRNHLALHDVRYAWALQTLLLGYPSLGLLVKLKKDLGPERVIHFSLSERE